MKAKLVLLACLGLVACGSPGTKATAQTEKQSEKVDQTADKSVLLLSGEGLEWSTDTTNTSIPFGASRIEVEKALSASFAQSPEKSANDECGAGPMEFSEYGNGFNANFQKDKFVGWFLESGASADIATTVGIEIGSSQSDVNSAYTLIDMEDSTLGVEFYADERVGGFLRGDEGALQVDSLYAGTNCFFR